LGLDTIGIDLVSCTGNQYNENVDYPSRTNILYRVKEKPTATTSYKYLVVSDRLDRISNSTDIFVVRGFASKERLKRLRRSIGVEVFLTDCKALDSLQVARWLKQLTEINRICNSINCQLIISSGASNLLEMVSGRSFDAILNICEIKPEKYWLDLEKWINDKISLRVTGSA